LDTKASVGTKSAENRFTGLLYNYTQLTFTC